MPKLPAGPATLLPPELDKANIEVHTRVENALKVSDGHGTAATKGETTKGAPSFP